MHDTFHTFTFQQRFHYENVHVIFVIGIPFVKRKDPDLMGQVLNSTGGRKSLRQDGKGARCCSSKFAGLDLQQGRYDWLTTQTVYAAGGNPTSAWLSGIMTKQVQFSVFVISGFLAALRGLILNARVMSASMTTMQGAELDSIAAVTIGGVSLMGGRGNLIGVVIGVIIIGVINNAMGVLGATPTMVDISKGAIIIAAVSIDYLRRR